MSHIASLSMVTLLCRETLWSFEHHKRSCRVAHVALPTISCVSFLTSSFLRLESDINPDLNLGSLLFWGESHGLMTFKNPSSPVHNPCAIPLRTLCATCCARCCTLWRAAYPLSMRMSSSSRCLALSSRHTASYAQKSSTSLYFCQKPVGERILFVELVVLYYLYYSIVYV